MTQLPDTYKALAEKYEELLRSTKVLSDSYVRLRTKIPGALLTNWGPSPLEIYTLTEDCLSKLLDEFASTRAANERLEAKLAAMRKIVL